MRLYPVAHFVYEAITYSLQEGLEPKPIEEYSDSYKHSYYKIHITKVEDEDGVKEVECCISCYRVWGEHV